MSIELTWLGHGGWSIKTSSHTVLLDPFVTHCPTATCKANELEADFILVSHGHEDHIADVPAIAKRTGAQVLANFEITQWLTRVHSIENVLPMNTGGTVEIAPGHVKMTNAFHSSSLPDGAYGGSPAGFLCEFEKKHIYFACDTAFFSDMRYISRHTIDLAIVPIGDTFTMGPLESLDAIRQIRPHKVAPAHYNTWPPIQQDAHLWARMVLEETTSQPIVIPPGGKIVL